jgi:hypothetical protein
MTSNTKDGGMTAAEEQLNKLLMHCVGFAETMLKSGGAFYPFAAFIDPDSRVSIARTNDADKHTDKLELYNRLTNTLVEMAKTSKDLAVAISADVNIPQQHSAPSSDGVRVHMESPIFSRFVYVPYKLSKEQGDITHVELFAPFSVEVAPQFFRLQ